MTSPLRIVSYNVRYFGHAVRGLASTRAGKREIAKAIAGLDPVPDAICLQEVETSSVRSNLGRPRLHPQETQLESFMSNLRQAYALRGMELPFEALYFRAHNYRLGEISLYTTGLAVLVNKRTLRIEQHNAEAPQGITHYQVAAWKDRKQSRICAHIRLEDAAGRGFHLFNTHLSLPSPFAREYWSVKLKMGYGVNQLAEANRLVDFVREKAGDEPFLICGDFNSLPGSPVFRFLCEHAGFVAPQLELGQIDLEHPRRFPTAGFMKLRMHLDHLFSDRRIHWLDLDGTLPFGEGPFQGLSDHTPLIGRFEIRPESGLAVPAS
ncbi:endonuclease/exonuclease/phosphatase family protein [Vulgatibacter incomptus]|uniref:Endonuclease/exonuclease/phosphatase family protein n=1 Tax=Vulgatibacter incomptus TaxID=1391653 RepID=A0A0K1P9E9_9BACT|nr:endonuclease/exonuclease/phosphatase family protein [Vulgatibacter incomptus]AKU90051.1 endonuclease/exonuclease/phosphatase family protein [Vulgatibacter incomptus]